MAPWDAEIEVDAALARRLIAGAHPRLAAAPLRALGVGWDNTVWATSDGIAWRFPRRAVAIRGVEREVALLPLLAPRLPVSIPDAAYPGHPSPLFPWPWFGSRLVAGREIADNRLGDRARHWLASDLAAFLRRLHGLQLPEFAALPVDPMGRADMARRVPRTRADLAAFDPTGALAARAEGLLTAAEGLAPDPEVGLVHGDLHLRHALTDASGRLTGVIDWGDMCLAPVSVDLSICWSAFGPAARHTFLSAYGEVGAPSLLRARVLALSLCVALAASARDRRIRALEAEALAGIERTLTDC
jgi:aminoglycoside phosphotransferase (APT) family kinase protein